MAGTCISEKTGVRARTEHSCFFCGEPIPPGSNYDRRTCVNSGEIVTMAMHPECNEATAEWDDMDYETFSSGTLSRGTGGPREG